MRHMSLTCHIYMRWVRQELLRAKNAAFLFEYLAQTVGWKI